MSFTMAAATEHIQWSASLIFALLGREARASSMVSWYAAQMSESIFRIMSSSVRYGTVSMTSMWMAA